jgi:hypothetical protein
MVNTMNIEPPISTYGKLGEWVEIANDEPITNDMVENFFIQIFRLLEINEMCFSSGAFVFENYGNVLFNLLTFNKLLIENNSYYCDSPLVTNSSITPANVHIIATETHDAYYKKYGRMAPIEIKPGECMPATKFYPLSKGTQTKTKFERIFNPKINNICGHCEIPAEIERSEPKGVVLYYPFYVTSQKYPTNKIYVIQSKTPLLYVKFEGFSVTENKFNHALEYVKKTFGQKKKYANVDTRREDKCDYNTTFRNKDIEFYRKYCPEDIEILEWYNLYIRTGCEFFVSKGLLTYFIKSFLLTSFNCNSAFKKSKKSSFKKSPSKKSPSKKSPSKKSPSKKSPSKKSPSKKSPSKKSPSKKMRVGGKIKYKTKRNFKSLYTIRTGRK